MAHGGSGTSPQSQVPLAPGRTSLVGTPVNIVDPGAVAARVATEFGERQVRRQAGISAEDLREARSLAVETGTVALEGARIKALDSADPDAVYQVYEDEVGDSLTTLSSGFQDERDKVTFDVQMENRMEAHSFDLNRRVTELKNERKIAALNSQIKVRLDSSFTTNLATIELNKADQLEDLEQMVANGVIGADEGQSTYTAFAIQADLNYVAALVKEAEDDVLGLDVNDMESGKWAEAFKAAADPSITPDLGADDRARARDAIIIGRSNMVRSHIAPLMDRGEPDVLGQKGRDLIDDLRGVGILTGTDHRELSVKLEGKTGDTQRDEAAGKIWMMQEEMDIRISPDNDLFQEAVNFGYTKFLREKRDEQKGTENESVDPIHTALEFTAEWGQIPEVVWARLGAAMTHEDIQVAANGAEAGIQIMKLSLVAPHQMKWTGAMRKVNDEINEYLFERWGDMETSREPGAIPRLDGVRAMQVIRDRKRAALGEGGAIERERKRAGLRTLFAFEEFGLETAMDAFNQQDPHWFDLKPENVHKGLFHRIQNDAIERMLNGEDQGPAFFNAAQDQILGGNLPTAFNGIREVGVWPVDRLMPPVTEPGTGEQLAHGPHKAEGVYQVLNLWFEITGDPIIFQMMEDLKLDRAFNTGLQLVDESGIIETGQAFNFPTGGQTLPVQIAGPRRNNLKYAMEFIAMRTEKPIEVVWAALNKSIFPDGGPGTNSWELMQVGDQITRAAVDEVGNKVPFSWLMVAITAEGNQIPLTTPGSPRGYRISYDKDVINPILVQVGSQTEKQKQDILNEIRRDTIEDANTIIDFGFLGSLRRRHLGIAERTLSPLAFEDDTKPSLMDESATNLPPDGTAEPLVQPTVEEEFRRMGGVKDGVIIEGIKETMLTPYTALSTIMKSHGYTMELTSGLDRIVGTENDPSYHQIGLAIDVKGNFLTKARGLQIAQELRAILGNEYIAIFETKDMNGVERKKEEWHFHIQLNNAIGFAAFEDHWGIRSRNDNRPINIAGK